MLNGLNSKHNQDKSVSAAKRMFLSLTPFVLFGIGIALISVFVFIKYIESSFYWDLMINPARSERIVNGDPNAAIHFNVSMETVTEPTYIKTVEKPVTVDDPTLEQIVYSNIDNFPIINWGDQWATLTIEYAGIKDAKVFNGDSNQILTYSSDSVGKLYGSDFPGEGGKTVLSAHVTRTFYSLQDIPIGEKIILKTIYGEYVYVITDTQIFEYTDATLLLEHADEETLICYTCYPRGTAFRTKRYAVICKKISGVDWIETEDAQ